MQIQAIPLTEVPRMPKNNNHEIVQGLFKQLYATFGEKSGDEVINIIVQEIGGFRVSIPDLKDLNRMERNRKIREQFFSEIKSGDERERVYRILADRWGMSRVQVRRIVNEREGVIE